MAIVWDCTFEIYFRIVGDIKKLVFGNIPHIFNQEFHVQLTELVSHTILG